MEYTEGRELKSLAKVSNLRKVLALSLEERRRFFDEKVDTFIDRMIESKAELDASTINDSTGAERIVYRNMEVTGLAVASCRRET